MLMTFLKVEEMLQKVPQMVEAERELLFTIRSPAGDSQ